MNFPIGSLAKGKGVLGAGIWGMKGGRGLHIHGLLKYWSHLDLLFGPRPLNHFIPTADRWWA